MLFDLVKVFLPTIFAFFLGVAITPFATHFFYKHKMWKRHSRKESTTVEDFHKIKDEKAELKTPRVGGVIIWLSVSVVTLLLYLLYVLFPNQGSMEINFLSRNQTLIPFFTLLLGAFVGLTDDLIQIYGKGNFAKDSVLWRRWKTALIFIISTLIGCWFYFKLGMNAIHLPFGGDLQLGFLIIPFFILVALATFSGGVIDGIDGLSGGVFASIFAAYSVIAFANNQIDLAAFSAVITGAIMAFLWFNIPPARFYMGETGVMALTITLATLAFLTDTVLVLPIVAMMLVVTSASVIIQMVSKKFRSGKRVFRVAPLHHHFEAIGWSKEKVTMRFWILSVVFAILGIIIAVISR